MPANIAYYSNLEVNENLDSKQALHSASQYSASLVCGASQETASTCYQQTTELLTIELLVDHFKNKSTMPDWFLIKITDECIKFMYFDNQCINGVQVTRCVMVHKDLTWQVKVYNSTLNPGVFTSTLSHDPPGKLVLKSDLITLLNAVGMKSELCPGCNSPEFDRIPKPCLDKNGNLKGTIETMSNSSSETWQTRRSSTCQYLICGKSYKTVRCQSCSQLNRSLCNFLYKSKTVVENPDKENQQPSSSNVCWKFLSDEDKLKRYTDQRRRRINAERREKYAKRKIEEEKKMLKLNKVDTDDVRIMFNQLDDEMKELECDDSSITVDNDLFYWSMQREVLQSGKTVWHPR